MDLQSTSKYLQVTDFCVRYGCTARTVLWYRNYPNNHHRNMPNSKKRLHIIAKTKKSGTYWTQAPKHNMSEAFAYMLCSCCSLLSRFECKISASTRTACFRCYDREWWIRIQEKWFAVAAPTQGSSKGCINLFVYVSLCLLFVATHSCTCTCTCTCTWLYMYMHTVFLFS